LQRRYADVEERAVDLRELELIEGSGEVTERATHERDGRDEVRWKRGRRIAVERDDAAAAFDDRARVAAGAEGRIDVGAARADGERSERLGKQNGDLRRLSGIVNRARAPS